MKIIISAIFLIASLFQGIVSVGAVAFPDTAAIASDLSMAIDSLAGEGIVRGYEDGTYRPNNTISVQEWARLLLRTKSLPENVDTYLSLPISRIDALKLLLTVWQVSPLEATSSFVDIPPSEQSTVAYFEQKNIVRGRALGMFAPQSPLTRAEAAKILFLARQSNLLATSLPTTAVTVTQNVVEIVDVSPMTLTPSGSGSLLFAVRNHGDGLTNLAYNQDYFVSVLSGGVIITGTNELGNGLYQVLFRAPSYVPAGPINIQIAAMVGRGYRTDINEYLRNKNLARADREVVSLARLIPSTISSGDTAQIIVTPQDGRGDPVTGLDVVAEVTRGSGDIVSPVMETPIGSGIYVGSYRARGTAGSQVEITVRIDNIASRPQTIIHGTVR